MPEWPTHKLLKHGPELPMKERIRRYQHNIRMIRESGCPVPAPALVDTLDPAEIEMWFADRAFTSHRLEHAIKAIARLPDDAMLPAPFGKSGSD